MNQKDIVVQVKDSFRSFISKKEGTQRKNKIGLFVGKRANPKLVLQENETPNFQKNEHFLSPNTHTCACAYLVVRNVRFSENLTCFVFL